MWWNEKWGTSSALVFQYVAKGITPATWLLCGMCCNHLATMTQYFSFYTLSCHLFSLFILFICASLQHFPSHSWLCVLHCCPFVNFFFPSLFSKRILFCGKLCNCYGWSSWLQKADIQCKKKRFQKLFDVNKMTCIINYYYKYRKTSRNVADEWLCLFPKLKSTEL